MVVTHGHHFSWWMITSKMSLSIQVSQERFHYIVYIMKLNSSLSYCSPSCVLLPACLLVPPPPPLSPTLCPQIWLEKFSANSGISNSKEISHHSMFLLYRDEEPLNFQFLPSWLVTKRHNYVTCMTLGLGEVIFGYVTTVHLKLSYVILSSKATTSQGKKVLSSVVLVLNMVCHRWMICL
jgi:hypothetical protein